MRSDAFTLSVAESDAVDLHLHTVVYDGAWTPETLVDHAQANGFKIIAVADHDSVANVKPTLDLATNKGIIVLPAVEVTSRFNGAIQHLLLYNVDIDDPVLLAMLSEARDAQIASAQSGLDILQRRGVELPHLEAIVAGRDLMPYYVAIALLKAGHGHSFKEVIDLAKEAGIDFDIAVDMARAIEVAHRQGALAILAHPGRDEMSYTTTTFEMIEQMMTMGLDGLEVYHGLHSNEDIAKYGDFAARHSLLVSCGSDSHGPEARTKPMPWPARNCRRLLETVGIEVLPVSSTTTI